MKKWKRTNLTQGSGVDGDAQEGMTKAHLSRGTRERRPDKKQREGKVI